jgi:diguanylate cyclase (GGDEF)-like protein
MIKINNKYFDSIILLDIFTGFRGGALVGNRIARLLTCLTIVMLFLQFNAVDVGGIVYADDEVNVLYISSYNGSFETNPEQIAGIQSILNEENILFDMEFMDSKRLYTEENFENFYVSLSYKLSILDPYDAVIVSDDNALQFVMDYQEELFGETPIVYFGINSLERAYEADANPYMTGIIEAISLDGTIEIAHEINKEATKIMALVDNTITGQEVLKRYYEIAEDYDNLEFSDINIEGYTYTEMEEILGEMTNDTIVVYLAMFNDKNGVVNSISENANICRDYASVPVYTPYSNGIGDGFFGGKVVYHYVQGAIAAQMVLDILHGTNVEDIEMICESPNQYLFDYELIQRFNIDESLIPKDAVLMNKELTFYESYKELIWTVVGIFVFLVIVILVLICNNIRRRKAENELTNANEELTATYEELSATEEELRSKFNELEISQDDLIKSKERYRLVFAASFEGLWDYDFKQDETYMSGEWHNKFIEKKTMENWYKIIDEEDYAEYMKLFERVKKGEIDRYSCEYRINDLENNLRWIYERGIATYDAKGQINRLVGAHMDITAKKEQEERITELAYYDVLTRLPNRVFLYEKLEGILENNESNEIKGAVLFLDVDDFKFINDTYGHTVGDKVLKEIGYRLDLIMKENLFSCRLGGDEFIIIVEDESDLFKINSLATEVSSIFSSPFFIDGKNFFLTASIGIVLYPLNGAAIEELLKNADTAMYKAKKLGKNQFMFFEKVMNEEMYDRMNMQNSLRNAIDNKEFILYYQPIVSAVTRQIVGYEALIRWQSQEHGLIPPNNFIPVAEEMGFIIPIGNWVFETACCFSNKINQNERTKSIVMVNVSPVQLLQDDFVDVISNIIKKTGVDPTLMGIEITETVFMESFETNVTKIDSLKSMGLHISLDDFGTGYSSLSYLRKLPIDTMKIDKLFIDDLLIKDSKKILTEDIITLAHKTDINVVAEGVEEEEQFVMLNKYGCDFIQGYLISKPVPEEEIIKMLEKNLEKE